MRATFALLRQDKQMLSLPFIGMVVGAIAAVISFCLGYGIGWLVTGHRGEVACYAGAALAGLGATIVSVYFQTALVIGANHRADGGEPTARSCLRAAWRLKWTILAWSVVTATVGFVLQMIEERLSFLGSLLNFVGGMAWGVATFVVVPVLVAEDVGPVTAIRRSTVVLRDTWGTSLRTAVRGGALAIVSWVAAISLLVAGAVMVFSGPSRLLVLGVALMAVGAVAMIVVGSLVGAVGAYARALIYRYAVGLPTPGVDTVLLAGAFRSKS
ncbi:hypothetical protein GEV29_11910 [Aeromicrobium sp. SMF47]|uniref:Uncharacterized protein n=1 Tax=Aeromicrobium yanjiei TaxID=2662028 RepID=A0A5Q2MIM6_9ACTN|nr:MULTISPECIES: DUF6159 family protein [Aeromicrobium]MRJ77244.1 hypothetical protein [Aeromicrobium yanjiei]MRK01612.1 hypothetical protein [Aeromicrobium sp. S22]QGG41621.1 hypothetical protein GEV26_09760 [Aeromicrobium yanjiei]